MTASHIVFLLILFAMVVGLVLLAIAIFSPSYMRDRLASFEQPDEAERARKQWLGRERGQGGAAVQPAVAAGRGLGALAAAHPLHECRLAQPGAATLYFASKTMLALIVPSIVALVLVAAAPKMGRAPVHAAAAAGGGVRLLPAELGAAPHRAAPPARDLRDHPRRARPADRVRRGRA